MFTSVTPNSHSTSQFDRTLNPLAWPCDLGWALLNLKGLCLYDLTFALVQFMKKAEN